MTDIGTAVAYLVAVSELAEVKDVRNAVRANLLARGGIEGPLGTIEIPHNRGEPEQSDLRFHDNKPLTRTPTSMPTQVVRTETVVTHIPAVRAANKVEALAEEPHRHHRHGPLAPPWEMPLVPTHVDARPVIKSPPKPADVINKGSLLDFFL